MAEMCNFPVIAHKATITCGKVKLQAFSTFGGFSQMFGKNEEYDENGFYYGLVLGKGKADVLRLLAEARRKRRSRKGVKEFIEGSYPDMKIRKVPVTRVLVDVASSKEPHRHQAAILITAEGHTYTDHQINDHGWNKVRARWQGLARKKRPRAVKNTRRAKAA